MTVLKQHEQEEYLGLKFVYTLVPYRNPAMYCVTRTAAEHVVIEPENKCIDLPTFKLPWDELFDYLYHLNPNCIAIATEEIDLSKRVPNGFIHKGEAVLFMGKIKNMPDHCIVVNKDGLVLWGYHTDNFRAARSHEL